MREICTALASPDLVLGAQPPAQPHSCVVVERALVQWYRERTADGRGGTRKTMIVALARKLLIALWRLVTLGEVPEGFILRPAL